MPHHSEFHRLWSGLCAQHVERWNENIHVTQRDGATATGPPVHLDAKTQKRCRGQHLHKVSHIYCTALLQHKCTIWRSHLNISSTKKIRKHTSESHENICRLKKSLFFCDTIIIICTFPFFEFSRLILVIVMPVILFLFQ